MDTATRRKAGKANSKAIFEPHLSHKLETREMALELEPGHVYAWLVKYGYFPESYVLPPAFTVVKSPAHQQFYPVGNGGRKYSIPTRQLVTVQFPRSEMTDRHFGIMHPKIHNDVAFHIAENWEILVHRMVPKDSDVVSYSFPIPLNARMPGRVGKLRSGRSIYEFLGMVDRDMASIAYRYSHLVKTDIKNFYPSVYTHSIAWALHGKSVARKQRHDFSLLGNRLDRLFQQANDGCTNGIAIGPAVSDVIAEVLASAVDIDLTAAIRNAGIKWAAFRFKDDYRFLVRSESDGRTVIKHLQSSLRKYNLEISDTKTAIHKLPEGLFREWSSLYFAVHPRARRSFSWKQFREFYLAVLRIDRQCPGTGVIDRFLADIITKNGNLKIAVRSGNLSKVLSMLLMLGSLRVKAFPKIMAIIEGVIRSPFGTLHEDEIVEYLDSYLAELAEDEARNKYLIAWIGYFFVSNGLKNRLTLKAKFKDPITRAIFSNRNTIFKDCPEFKVFAGCRAVSKNVTLLRHLEVFMPPPEPDEVFGGPGRTTDEVDGGDEET